MSNNQKCCTNCGDELVRKTVLDQPPPLQLVGLLLRVASILGILVGLLVSGFAVYISLQIDKAYKADWCHQQLWAERDRYLLSVTLKAPSPELMEFDGDGNLKAQSEKHMSKIYRQFFFQTYRRQKEHYDSQRQASLMFKFFGILGLILTIPVALIVRYVGKTLSLPRETMVCPQCPTSQ